MRGQRLLAGCRLPGRDQTSSWSIEGEGGGGRIDQVLSLQGCGGKQGCSPFEHKTFGAAAGHQVETGGHQAVWFWIDGDGHRGGYGAEDGVVAEVVAVTLSWAVWGVVPVSFQVIEAGLAVASAMTARDAGLTCHWYTAGAPPASMVYRDGVG